MSQYMINFDDPALANGSQIATTGETKKEYEERMLNQINMPNGTYMNSYSDQNFVTTLPYTLQIELKDIDKMDPNIFKNSFSVFIEGLKESFGPDLTNADDLDNDAVINTLAIQQYEIQKTKYPTELCTTEIGGNDAINPYWAFNENDDIIYPSHALDPEHCKYGIGRVYAEMYQRKQVILWLTFGVPKYSGIWDFYTEAYNPDLAKEMHSGVTPTMFNIGRIIGGLLSFTWNLATAPIWILNQIGKLFTTYTITKYCELNATMPLYFKTVNNLMSTLAVNMGIQKNTYVDDSDSNTVQVDPDNLPGVMREGLDIYRIMAKRAIYVARRNGDDLKDLTAEQLYEIHRKAQLGMAEKKVTKTIEVNGKTVEVPVDVPEDIPKEYSGGIGTGFMANICDAFMANATASTAYVGFRVEKTTDASETISNQTGENELKGILNSGVQSREKIKQFTADGNLSDRNPLFRTIEAVVGGISNIASGIASSFDISGLGGLTHGTGHYDIPDVWKESSYSANFNFTTKLTSHYCDRVSIFQNCYVPLCMILAAALPRQVGKNTYIQPFFCRGMCKGRFAVSYGIIDSVSITRGNAEYGWTEEGFPTTINVSWSIKDLSPLVFVAVNGDMGKGFMDIFRSNTNMMEYLSTLGGLGLRERVLFFPRIMRKFKAWWNVNFETRLKNPFFWGSTFGNIPGLQTVMAWKWSRLAN